jgi:hypothetical protein
MCTIKDNVHQGLLDTQCNVEETLILFFCAKHQAFWESHQFFFSLAASFLFHFSSSDDFVLLLILHQKPVEFTPRLLFFAMLRNLHLSLLGVSFHSWILHVYWLYWWHFDICSYCKYLTHLLELQVTIHRNLCLWHDNVSFYYCSDLQLQNAVLHQFCLVAKELSVSVDFATLISVFFSSFFFTPNFSCSVFLGLELSCEWKLCLWVDGWML